MLKPDTIDSVKELLSRKSVQPLSGKDAIGVFCFGLYNRIISPEEDKKLSKALWEDPKYLKDTRIEFTLSSDDLNIKIVKNDPPDYSSSFWIPCVDGTSLIDQQDILEKYPEMEQLTPKLIELNKPTRWTATIDIHKDGRCWLGNPRLVEPTNASEEEKFFSVSTLFADEFTSPRSYPQKDKLLIELNPLLPPAKLEVFSSILACICLTQGEQQRLMDSLLSNETFHLTDSVEIFLENPNIVIIQSTDNIGYTNDGTFIFIDRIPVSCVQSYSLNTTVDDTSGKTYFDIEVCRVTSIKNEKGVPTLVRDLIRCVNPKVEIEYRKKYEILERESLEKQKAL